MNSQHNNLLRTKKEVVQQASANQIGKSTEAITDNRYNGAIQKKANHTGLPDSLKSGIENLSGHSMDDVQVQYNSSQPAQVNAHAYAQGTDIHIAPGQEKHLPHEAWHVVQQKQGRVKPTMQLEGKVNINDNNTLEKEADTMGGIVMQRVKVAKEEAAASYDVLGADKWREFIDAKDHENALGKAHDKTIDHPGEYYNYHNDGGGMRKKFESFRDFVQADNFVKSRIGKKVTAGEYLHIHDLAFQPESAHLKGIRTDDAKWGLPITATKVQLENIEDKGLQITTEKDRHAITAPMPRGGINNKLEEHFNDYHLAQAKAERPHEKFHNIIGLYQKLETLHAFTDGTSRTNHLLLNKLLSEHGLGPTILQEPNSPMFSQVDFGKEVIKGMIAHRNLAQQQGEGSKAALRALRKKHVPEELTAEQISVYKRFGVEPEPTGPKFTPPKDDPDVSNERIDLGALMEAYDIPPEHPRAMTSTSVPSINMMPSGTVSASAKKTEPGFQAGTQPPKMLSQVDKMLLTKFMGKKKAEETDKLYADQVRRYRNRNNR